MTADPSDLDTPLKKLVGEKTAKALAGHLDLHTAGDLIYHFPRRYDERGEHTDGRNGHSVDATTVDVSERPLSTEERQRDADGDEAGRDDHGPQIHLQDQPDADGDRERGDEVAPQLAHGAERDDHDRGPLREQVTSGALGRLAVLIVFEHPRALAQARDHQAAPSGEDLVVEVRSGAFAAQEEQALVERAQRGDRDAFGELADKLGAKVAALLLGHGVEALAKDGVKTLEDFATCADWELAGGWTTVDGERVKDDGLLEPFDVSLEEAQYLVMKARVELGIIDPAELEAMMAEGEETEEGAEEAEATEEAIYNAILKATTVTSSRGRLEAIPLGETLKILEKYNALHWDETLPPTAR